MSARLMSIFGRDNKSWTISVWPLEAAKINGVLLNTHIEFQKCLKNEFYEKIRFEFREKIRFEIEWKIRFECNEKIRFEIEWKNKIWM